MKDPIKVIQGIVDTHEYNFVEITKTFRDKGDPLFILKTTEEKDEIPLLLQDYVLMHYNVTTWSKKYIEFTEYSPIGVEINSNEDFVFLT